MTILHVDQLPDELRESLEERMFSWTYSRLDTTTSGKRYIREFNEEVLELAVTGGKRAIARSVDEGDPPVVIDAKRAQLELIRERLEKLRQ